MIAQKSDIFDPTFLFPKLPHNKGHKNITLLGCCFKTKMEFQTIEVTCYSGYKVNEKPMSFTVRGKKHLIIEIVDRWYEGSSSSSMPPLDYFKVKADDGNNYIIRYNALFDSWSILI